MSKKPLGRGLYILKCKHLQLANYKGKKILFGFIEAYNSLTTGVTVEYISILKGCNHADVGVFTTFYTFHHLL